MLINLFLNSSFEILNLFVVRISPRTTPLHKTSSAQIFAKTIADLSIKTDSAIISPENFPATWTFAGWLIFPFVSVFFGKRIPKTVFLWSYVRNNIIQWQTQWNSLNAKIIFWNHCSFSSYVFKFFKVSLHFII